VLDKSPAEVVGLSRRGREVSARLATPALGHCAQVSAKLLIGWRLFENVIQRVGRAHAQIRMRPRATSGSRRRHF
jgi:hypothetical protein